MEELYQNILKELKEKILDVDVDNGVIHYLRQENILNDNDIKSIKNVSKPVQIEKLLEILPRCGRMAFICFQESLKPQYPWLYEEMSKLVKLSKSNDDNNLSSQTTEHRLPDLIVCREKKITQLRDALEKLKPEGYVVLHGMKGYGRSCLLAKVLEDGNLTKRLFKNKFYWLKFSYKDDIEDEILIQLHHLYFEINKSHFSLNIERTKKDIIRTLYQHFRADNQSSLLILDDIYDERIIDAFDFPCKLLVITPNIQILKANRSRQVIEMKDGFTEMESLGLFAEALGTNINLLPPEAKNIHHLCNGMPLLIAMFAATFQEFKEEMKNNTGRWRYYEKALIQKDSTNAVIEKFLATQKSVFNLCINRLPKEARDRYEDLAIFGEDVNIKSQTLEILWGKDKYQVDDIMLEYRHKSLVVKKWNDRLNSYIYGVHDLLLSHLKTTMSEEQLSKKHAKFIEKYSVYCHDNFSKLPDDNYIYSYIGYHLEEGRMYSRFKQLYFDFDFLQAKILYSGLNDLLNDFKKYKKYITDNEEEYLDNLKDLENFFTLHEKTLAEYRQRKCLNLFQIGLNYNNNKFVNNMSLEYAKSHPQYLYLINERKLSDIDNLINNEMPTEIYCARFTDDNNKVLIGSKFGKILLWDIATRRYLPFSSQTNQSAIVKIILASELDEFFITLNKNSNVEKFLLKLYENPNLPLDEEKPWQKQLDWDDLTHPPRHTSDKVYLLSEHCKNDTITDIALSQDNECVAACTKEGTIIIWKIDGTIINYIKNESQSFQKLVFVKNTAQICTINTKGVISVFCRLQSNGHYNYIGQCNISWRMKDDHSDENSRKVVYMGNIEQDSGPSTQLVVVFQNQASYFMMPINNNGVCQPDSRNIARINNAKFITATLTYDEQYLITADSDDFIKVWYINGNFQPESVFPGRAISLDTYNEVNCHLIISANKHSIQRRAFHPNELNHPIGKPLFDAVMKPLGQSDIVALQMGQDKVALYNGDILSKEIKCTKLGKIIELVINSDGTKILFSTEKKYVALYDSTADKAPQLFDTTENSKFIKFLTIDNSLFCLWKDDEKLHFWNEFTQCEMVIGDIVEIHTISIKHFLIVTRDRQISINQLDELEKKVKSIDSYSENDSEKKQFVKFCYSTLNHDKSILAVLRSDKVMSLYYLKDYESNCYKISNENNYNLFRKLSCCAFSPDDKFLAIGCEKGLILLFSMTNFEKCGELDFHCNSIRQLHWAPLSIGVPILLSVNCDELIWWNTSLIKVKNRRSRIGDRRSLSTPTIGLSPGNSMRINNSQSENADLSNLASRLELELMEKNVIDKVHEYWASKVAMDKEWPALLAMAPLSSTCKAKVCVSKDFDKFLLVDIHGSINNYKLFGYPQVD